MRKLLIFFSFNNKTGEQPEISPHEEYQFIGEEEANKGGATKNKDKSTAQHLSEYLGVFIFALLGTIIVKTFLFQIFLIPSGSMENTLRVGDHVVVNRLASHFTPIARGEVVVFQDPDNWMELDKSVQPTPFRKLLQFLQIRPDQSKPLLIKRVIGIGGDEVICCSKTGSIIVNKQEINESYIHPGSSPSDIKFKVLVPKGYIFVMGDHRDNSSDSRFHFSDKYYGFVPQTNVLGRALITLRSGSIISIHRGKELSSIQPNKDYTR